MCAYINKNSLYFYKSVCKFIYLLKTEINTTFESILHRSTQLISLKLKIYLYVYWYDKLYDYLRKFGQLFHKIGKILKLTYVQE